MDNVKSSKEMIQSNVKKKDEKVGSKLSYADIFIHENYLKTSGVLYYMDQE